ncbi:MAG: alpha/beta hydrolase [Rhizobiales bacterium 63-7]|uniref:alpha/beta fold hydrolase n=1 Tax=Rhizobium sp. YJ-22 TaxID=3037556 RepID=UPI00092BF67A|nr:alpha/beta hydrolase [Rhizobium sp. YJ-22]MBN9032161.1 alpha/beta fold hydrolase [Hyphomicrobiales bacterium]MDG3579754.1 alpha/beta hydrolase [Rhizobium sp. YJ-22]OJU68537.1 MAG: alpha/beta hydrolase [Rhizobiales bacterium 63-7]
MDFETLTLDIDGVSTVVKAIGEGPAVLALHGAATIEGHDWARGLADRFRVYLPFHPGFGESAEAPHVNGMQDIIVHNLRLISALGLDRPHLVGHSMGGWMAAEMAVVAGERFNRLVLNAPAGLNHPDHPGAALSSIAPDAFPAYLAHRAEVAARYFPGGAECASVEDFVAAREKEGPALGNILKVHGMGHPNLGRWLSRIPNETLVVWGEKDRMLPASQAPLWVAAIPHARLLMVEEVGHLAMQEDPRIVTAIGDFLAG